MILKYILKEINLVGPRTWGLSLDPEVIVTVHINQSRFHTLINWSRAEDLRVISTDEGVLSYIMWPFANILGFVPLLFLSVQSDLTGKLLNMFGIRRT